MKLKLAIVASVAAVALTGIPSAAFANHDCGPPDKHNGHSKGPEDRNNPCK